MGEVSRLSSRNWDVIVDRGGGEDIKQYKQVSRWPRSGGEPAPSKVDNGAKFDQLPNLLPPVVSSDLP
ncbi:hypothetical protein Tco_1140656, partial [Tanacetum coccineum]